MARDLIGRHGKRDTRSDIPVIRVYEGVGVSRSTSDAVYDSFKTEYDHLYDEDQIPGWQTYEYDTDFDRSDYPDLNAVQAVNQWLTDNDYQERGFHLGLHTKSSNNPGAAGPAGTHAWQNYTFGQTNCDQDSNANISNTALHESFHKFVDNDIQKVADMCGDGDRSGEHTLGVVKYESDFNFYYETPFGSPGASPHGDCSGSDAKPDSYWDSATQCTSDGIGYTYDDRF